MFNNFESKDSNLEQIKHYRSHWYETCGMNFKKRYNFNYAKILTIKTFLGYFLEILESYCCCVSSYLSSCTKDYEKVCGEI